MTCARATTGRPSYNQRLHAALLAAGGCGARSIVLSLRSCGLGAKGRK